jgi:hypothetical protein
VPPPDVIGAAYDVLTLPDGKVQTPLLQGYPSEAVSMKSGLVVYVGVGVGAVLVGVGVGCRERADTA